MHSGYKPLMETGESPSVANARSRSRWKQDPEGVRSNILAVALEEFAKNGLSGARIDEIAARTRTSKRMIYYYFGDKEGLYRRALEDAYREVRRGEEKLLLDDLAPAEALRRLAEFTFDHHRRNPNFIRLVMIENIHNGDYLRQSDLIGKLNEAAISRVAEIYGKGVAEGVFRPGLTPLEIHWQISALSFFNVSNVTTFSLLFGNELFTGAGQARLRGSVGDAVLRFVASQPPDGGA